MTLPGGFIELQRPTGSCFCIDFLLHQGICKRVQWFHFIIRFISCCVIPTSQNIVNGSNRFLFINILPAATWVHVIPFSFYQKEVEPPSVAQKGVLKIIVAFWEQFGM